MTLTEKVAVALFGEHAPQSKPCMEQARRACEVFAEWAESKRARDLAARAVVILHGVPCSYDQLDKRAKLRYQRDAGAVLRGLAAAVRGGDDG